MKSEFTSLTVNFGKRKVEMPYVYREDRAYIPERDPDFLLMEFFFDVYMGLEDGHVYLAGETGLGKTEGVKQIAAYMNHPLRYINMRGDINPEHFIGYLLAKEGTTYFEPGILLDCMENGYLLLTDEWDYGNPMVMSALNNVMQSEDLYVPELGKRIIAHPDFRIIATANTFGGGDMTGFYAGTRVQNKALMDRFDTFVEAEFPTASDLKVLIYRKYGEVSKMTQIIQFVYEMRKAVAAHEINSPFGIRSTSQFVKKMRKNIYSPWKCVQLSFAHSLDETSMQVCKGITQRVFGGKD